jgi:hypothetical protein
VGPGHRHKGPEVFVKNLTAVISKLFLDYPNTGYVLTENYVTVMRFDKISNFFFYRTQYYHTYVYVLVYCHLSE